MEELRQEVENFKQENESLKSEISEISRLVNDLIKTPPKLTVLIDQNSRDVILDTVRDFNRRLDVGVAAAFIVSPQSGYLRLTGTAARTSDTTTAIRNGSFVGQELIIEGTDNTNTITIKDAANTQLAGDCTLGIYDTLTVWWSGQYWIEKARSNN